MWLLQAPRVVIQTSLALHLDGPLGVVDESMLRRRVAVDRDRAFVITTSDQANPDLLLGMRALSILNARKRDFMRVLNAVDALIMVLPHELTLFLLDVVADRLVVSVVSGLGLYRLLDLIHLVLNVVVLFSATL